MVKFRPLTESKRLNRFR